MSNKFLKFVATLVIGIAGATNASASILGSFNSDPNGQDTPVGRVIAAINISQNPSPNLVSLEFLYKNNYEDGAPGGDLEGPFQSAFSVTGDTTSGTISIIGATPGFTPLYLTVKMGSLGFNLYKFNGNSIAFNNTFYGDGANGVYYLTDTWSTSGTAASTGNGISHVSVWGVTAVIPEPGSLLVWMTGMGCVGLVGLRRKRML